VRGVMRDKPSVYDEKQPEYLSALGCGAVGRDDLQLELLNEANRHIEALAGVRGDDSCDVRTAVRARDKIIEKLMASLSNANPNELTFNVSPADCLGASGNVCEGGTGTIHCHREDCKSCGGEKSVSAYYRNGTDGIAEYAVCDQCHYAWMKVDGKFDELIEITEHGGEKT